MTREIKFRQLLWDYNADASLGWHYWGFVDGRFIEPATMCVNPENNYQSNQFTGLKDKNGKEIYFEDYVEDEVGQIWIVKWNKTEIDLLNISTGDIMSIRNNLEIKSNIYENTFKFTPNYTEIS